MAKKVSTNFEDLLATLKAIRKEMGGSRAAMAIEVPGVTGQYYCAFKRAAKGYGWQVLEQPLPIGWTLTASRVEGKYGMAVTITTSEDHPHG